MKTNSIQQEILLLTGTTFSQRELCGKDAEESKKNISKKDQLEEACWNGLLHELLPDLIVKSLNGDRELTLWQIRQAASFLEIDLCDSPAQTDRYLSIDPYTFLPNVFEN